AAGLRRNAERRRGWPSRGRRLERTAVGPGCMSGDSRMNTTPLLDPTPEELLRLVANTRPCASRSNDETLKTCPITTESVSTAPWGRMAHTRSEERRVGKE